MQTAQLLTLEKSPSIYTPARRTRRRQIGEAFRALRLEVREALRRQHPEWIEPDASSPICDSYEERLTYLLELAVN